ncbi:protein NLP3-like [Rhododendron vialii]|uniref:protein NLP3-like n=1 Tax=Rhododendron vialii TaxID=182163 RepID=UPI00265E87C2|nr:protein NLP3-like [Rhododendron vialii]
MVGFRNIEELESDEPIVQDSEEELNWLNSSPLRHWLNSSPSQHTYSSPSQHSYSPRLFLNENRSEEENPNEDFELGCSEAAKNIDEVEAVGNIVSERTGDDCEMADQLNSECLGKKKTKEKNPVGERRNKKTNGVKIAIPLALEDILQTKGMHSKDAAKHLKVSITKLKSSCREYGIHRWPPRNEHKFIRQSLPNETPVVVSQKGIPQLSSYTVPSTQALTVTVDTNSFFENEILPPQFLATAQQENLDAGLGNDEDEAIGMGVKGTGVGVMVEAQLNSR